MAIKTPERLAEVRAAARAAAQRDRHNMTIKIASPLRGRLRAVSKAYGLTLHAAAVMAILDFVERQERGMDPMQKPPTA